MRLYATTALPVIVGSTLEPPLSGGVIPPVYVRLDEVALVAPPGSIDMGDPSDPAAMSSEMSRAGRLDLEALVGVSRNTFNKMSPMEILSWWATNEPNNEHATRTGHLRRFSEIEKRAGRVKQLRGF